jgi:hypothetical protein
MSKYQFGGASFPTKKAVTAHIRAVRAATPHKQPLTDPAVLAFLQLHPEWEQKSDGMQFVTVDWVKGAPAAPRSLEICILRTDGSIMDISWGNLVDYLSPPGVLVLPTPSEERLKELRAAARHDIDYQIAPLRKPKFHVDHVAPQTFEILLRAWFDTLSRPLLSIDIADNHGPVVIRSIADDELRASWQQYHQDNAVLEVITAEEHASRKKVRVDWSDVLHGV